ncbi:RsmB/NOP family class I SAM-dependent RNA methyltransferase [Croceicoccus mobilis]|uniref:rRNA cytosine-C5-methylase n=1 Tax=Croceicoccus mobilis TaxID=1703339 RepID=A0A917DNV5_9SPHN|nr:RsmB/NOP family class I SAM-dependent RNA methyltransferase [Croceicoccus mobilis]GGD55067.1 rRNA cytosine-C5-methylase [Croceicoccus mobilis]
MTPAARIQAAIELLDGVIEAAKKGGAPADRIVADGLRARRYAGSKDRRAIRELVYGAIRACGPVPETGRAAMLRLAEGDPEIAPLFDGSGYGPAAITAGEPVAEGGIAPEWLAAKLAESDIAGEEAEALLGRAPLDIRVNTLKASRDTIDLPEAGVPLQTPHGLRLPAGTPVESWNAFREGLIEVQDAGSQIACMATEARPGELVVDLCAGAGGKTLSLAAAMENAGTLIASDTNRQRLSNLAPRAERAGVTNVTQLLLNPGEEDAAFAPWKGKADAVLIDAPCSGTGTWRRNPESRWRITPQEIARLAELQRRLAFLGAGLLRPGGRLIYVVCSLLDEEGAANFGQFLGETPDMVASPFTAPAGRSRGTGTRLTPFHDETDGFFFARAVKVW